MGRYPAAILLAAILALILIGDSAGLMDPVEPPFLGKATLCARVIRITENDASGKTVILEADSVDSRAVVPFRLRGIYLSSLPELYPGRRVWLTSRIDSLTPDPDVPDVFPATGRLRRRGVSSSVTFIADSIHAVAPGGGLTAACRRLNRRIVHQMDELPLTVSANEMLSAMLLGNGEIIAHEKRNTYSAAGLSHIMALSGMHVGIIAMIIGFMLWPFYLGRHVRLKLMLTILALWAYVALTGLAPSAVRAAIMTTVYMTGRILQRRSEALNSLCLAAFLILLFRPADLWAEGFQMSFAAVLGIILFYPKINRVDRRRHPRLYALVSYPALSVSAMLFTSLLAAWHFHTFPLYFLAANLLAAPVIPLFIGSGIVALAIGWVAPANLLAAVLDWIAGLFAGLPEAQISALYPPLWLVLGLFAAMIVLGLARRKWLRLQAGLWICVMLAMVLVLPAPRVRGEQYYIQEPRFTHLLQTYPEGACTLFTTAHHYYDVQAMEARAEVMFRDFAARRRIAPPPVVSVDSIIRRTGSSGSSEGGFPDDCRPAK